MKYANYKFFARGVNNLGDNLQILAIDNIYQKMGIDLNDVIYIDTQELSTYMGEYVILPVTMPLVDYVEGGIAKRFSPYIIPVFLGLTMVKQSLNIEEINYLKKYEPIGCRDEWTLNTMRKYQIDSYLNGCISITLPKRDERCVKNNKVYIVDIDKKLYDMIPDRIKENAEERTHFISAMINDPKVEAYKQYKEYIENAALIITSLLHCTVPCIAAGIPVILLRDKVTYRMSWLEKIIPIYCSENMNLVDWNPSVKNLEQHKNIVLESTIQTLKKAFEKYQRIMDLSYFYENRKKSIYVNDATLCFVKFINDNWIDKNIEYRYSIWGLTQMSEWLVDYISENYPNAKLCHIYDSYRKLRFRNLLSISPESIIDNIDEFVFVTTNGAVDSAKTLFDRIGKEMDTYCFMTLQL